MISAIALYRIGVFYIFYWRQEKREVELQRCSAAILDRITFCQLLPATYYPPLCHALNGKKFPLYNQIGWSILWNASLTPQALIILYIEIFIYVCHKCKMDWILLYVESFFLLLCKDDILDLCRNLNFHQL